MMMDISTAIVNIWRFRGMTVFTLRVDATFRPKGISKLGFLLCKPPFFSLCNLFK